MQGERPVDLESFSATVAAIYSAAVDPETWPAALGRMAVMFDSVSVAMATGAPGDRRISLNIGLGSAAVDSYNAYFRDLDPIARIVARTSIGEVGRVFESLPQQQLTSGEFFVDWARPSGLGDGLFSRFADRSDGAFWLCVAGEPHCEFASTGRVALLRALVPHLRAAAGIGVTMSEATRNLRLTTDILEHLDRGALLVDEHGIVHHMNAAARAIVNRGDGLIVVRGGRLGTLNCSDSVALRNVVVGACRSGRDVPKAGSISVRRATAGDRYVVHAVPIYRPEYADHQAGGIALVTVIDPTDTTSTPANVWRVIYGLTAREAEVAEQVVCGEGLQTVADTLGITLSTVRTHLQRVFDKTGTHRQKELARLLLTTTPIMT